MFNLTVFGLELFQRYSSRSKCFCWKDRYMRELFTETKIGGKIGAFSQELQSRTEDSTFEIIKENKN